MTENALQKLIDGYREFRAEYLSEQHEAYREWAAQQQNPRVMMIACSDSRVNPAILTHAGLGEVFMVNNVANLVPPYKEGRDTHHSTSSALEFAVCHLEVEHVIVLGHSGCGGIKALLQGSRGVKTGGYSFIEPWMDIAKEAKEQVQQEFSDDPIEKQASHCEKAALLISLYNLWTFPWIESAVNEGKLALHAWYFDIEPGELCRYDSDIKDFRPVVEK